MNAQEALQWIQTLLSAKTGKCLDPVQQAIFIGCWDGYKYEDIKGQHQILFGRSLNDDASRLWKLLHRILDVEEKITKTNFRGIIEAKIIQERENPLQSPAILPIKTKAPLSCHHWREVPTISQFYGRTEEIETLKQWIATDKSPLISIQGLGGIGKTYLAAKLAQEIKNQFDYILYHSLKSGVSAAEIVSDLIQAFAKDKTDNLADLSGKLNYKLIYDYLRVYRCCLILDDLENILDRGESRCQYREGYQQYESLFRDLVEISHEKSCIIVVGRQLPRNFKQFRRDVPTLTLRGLDVDSAIHLLKSKGLSGSEGELRQLTDTYGQNPFMLKLAAELIQRNHRNNINEFLQYATRDFENINQLINEQFDRLSEIEKRLVDELATQDQPIPISALRQAFSQSSGLTDAIDSLINTWIEISPEDSSESHYTLQPILRDFIRKKLN